MNTKNQGSGSFNIRVYGIWVQEGRVLVTEERIGERWVQKFPGGGMDWGEGTLDTLQREWREELGMNPGEVRHFYTTDFFQASAFDDSQVLSIYYLVCPEWPRTRLLEEIQHLEPPCRAFWIPLSGMDEDAFSLPIDRVVAAKILEELSLPREQGEG